MTASHDSSLFDNDVTSTDATSYGATSYGANSNDALYSSERHAGYEPFAQALPPSGEPLFPAAPTPVHFDYLQSAQNQARSNPVDIYAEDQGNQLYDAGKLHVGHESALYALPMIEAPVIEAPVTEAPVTEAPAPVDAPAPPLLMPTPASSEFEFAPPQPEDRYSVASEKLAMTERDLRFNQQYAVLTNLMQHGAWPQALEKIKVMHAEYPEVDALGLLLEEAMLKTELMANWSHKIKGRRLTVGQEWLIRRSLPFLVLLLLFISGTSFYQTYIAPSRQVVAMERANQALVEEATALLQVGQIDEAISLYNLVLTRNPDFSAAEQGLLDASRLSGLAVTYDIAIRVANKGNLERSLLMLQSIKAKSPSFRDIDARLARVNSLLQAERAYSLAERAFAQHRWTDAIAQYEETRLLVADYQAARVGLQLSAAYFMASQRLMSQWPSAQFGTEQIADFLRKAQEINGQNETINTFLTNLDKFIKGERALQNDNLEQTVKVWRELYDVQSNFLGGYLAEQLYRAYLTLAAEMRTDDPAYARELYTLAAAMPVSDSSEARNQLQNLGAVLPVVQPTPTAQPTVAFMAAPLAAPIAMPEPTPESMPAPSAAPVNAYQGWIAFRSTRTGAEEIYIMRGDGSEQQLAPEELRGQIDTLYQAAQRSPDHRMAFVQSAAGRSDANIYVASSDGVNNTAITDHKGDEYDPVWSPTGDRITFVANHTGNDEIWIMLADGSEQRQLTFNNWEWDKHPTWSPDGNQIAFFSNRSGQRQVWAMAPDGSNQRNLSSNTYDDWDPVWIQ